MRNLQFFFLFKLSTVSYFTPLRLSVFACFLYQISKINKQLSLLLLFNSCSHACRGLMELFVVLLGILQLTYVSLACESAVVYCI